MDSSTHRGTLLCQISWELYRFMRYQAEKQTDRQTDRQTEVKTISLRLR